jgi:hypothetical protein
MAGATGLEPATSGVTGRRSNQLSYAPVASTEAASPTPPSEGCQGVARRSCRVPYCLITATWREDDGSRLLWNLDQFKPALDPI